jgi:hypothetical protein
MLGLEEPIGARKRQVYRDRLKSLHPCFDPS